jgi:tRNA threonylcarbamoyladenosine biosynthesis protein TsaE
MTDTVLQLATGSPGQTMAMAAALAVRCLPGDVLALQGTLGAGKTCFVKGLARGLGIHDDRRVISPTFVLLRQYKGRLTLHHFDAYRLASAEDMEAIGCAEIFDGDGVSVVEWADHVPGCLPAERFVIAITVTGPSARSFEVRGVGRGPSSRMPGLADALSDWACGVAAD